RRRDQQDAAEDPGRAAGGDGGTAGLGGGDPAAAARAGPGRGHPEPHRVRGHLSAAGGAAPPVPGPAGRAGARPGGRERRPRPGRHAAGFDPGDLAAAGIRPAATAADVAAARAAVRGVRVAPEVAGYIVDLCRATRQSPSLRLGASPRGATALQATARAWAWLA